MFNPEGNPTTALTQINACPAAVAIGDTTPKAVPNTCNVTLHATGAHTLTLMSAFIGLAVPRHTPVSYR